MIYQTRDTGIHRDIQTLRKVLKIRRGVFFTKLDMFG